MHKAGRIVRPFSLGTYQVHDSFPVVFELSETTGDESNLVPYEMLFAPNIPARPRYKNPENWPKNLSENSPKNV